MAPAELAAPLALSLADCDPPCLRRAIHITMNHTILFHPLVTSTYLYNDETSYVLPF